ncbi:MAG: hypothetical protein CSA58_10230 [Micrococcales bacterium]|nr:MAG: hypothetical protein CSA58_10230 [Micrococcales bacterium]
MTVDLNADLGESFGTWRLGDDEAMLRIVTSANVACGFHAGDPLTLRRTCAAAARAAVAVGAQVSYQDLAGFGRRFVDVGAEDLTADVLYQLGALEAMCRLAGTRVAYVKPHGALYHAVIDHEQQAVALVDAISAYDPALPLLGPGSGAVARIARDRGLRVVAEAFADRAYTADGRLVSRTEPGAVLTDPDQVAERVVALATHGSITGIEGGQVPIQAESICTHGDSPGAVQMAGAVRRALERAGVAVRAFTAVSEPPHVNHSRPAEPVLVPATRHTTRKGR